jgi:ATP-dependent DNA ligase
MTSSSRDSSGSANDPKTSRPPRRSTWHLNCLYLDGRDLRPLTLRERRTELEAVVENDHTLIFPARRLAANGPRSVVSGGLRCSQVLEAGYEGLVAKDDASPYKGGRTLSWLKVKQQGYRVEERA